MADVKIFRQRYRIDRKLFRRNSGDVFLVTDLKSKNNELKMMKLVRHTEFDVSREIRRISKFNNEFITRFDEMFLEDEFVCIVTEFCDGDDLDQRLKQLKKENQTLDESQIVEWLLQILVAVQYLHESNVFHGNLKTKNIFLNRNQIKLDVFHCGRIETFETPFNSAAEVLKKENFDAKSDVWSIGCLLYEMCELQHAFEGKDSTEVLHKVVKNEKPNLSKKYSKELNDLLKQMLTKSSKLRPEISEILRNRIFSFQPTSTKIPVQLLKRRQMAKPFHNEIRSIAHPFISINRFEYPMDLRRLTVYPSKEKVRLLVAEPKFVRSAAKEDRIRLVSSISKTKIEHFQK